VPEATGLADSFLYLLGKRRPAAILLDDLLTDEWPEEIN
jgi:hypothetical protein